MFRRLIPLVGHTPRTRGFWCVCKETIIGRIEGISPKCGIFFSHPEMLFKITSSNMADGTPVFCGLKAVIDDPEVMNRLHSAMVNRLSVTIEAEEHLIGSPFKGYIFGMPRLTKLVNVDDGNEKIQLRR